MDQRGINYSDPNILVGKPVVKGTHLSVEFLLGSCRRFDQEPALDNCPKLTPEALQAVFAGLRRMCQMSRCFLYRTRTRHAL